MFQVLTTYTFRIITKTYEKKVNNEYKICNNII